MAILSISSVGIPGGGGTSSSINTTGANLLVVSLSYFSTNLPVLSDSFGNTWQSLISSVGSGNCSIAVFYALNPVVGAGHTFTLSASITVGQVEAFSGVLALVQQTSAADLSGTSVQPGSLTPGSNGALFVAATAFNGAPTDNSVVVDSSFVLTGQQPFTPGVFFGNAMAYLIQSIASAINPTFSWSGSSSEARAFMAQFSAKPSASGIPNSLMLMGCGT